MKRWILVAFVWLVGCNSYVDPDWYNKPAFTEHLDTLYAYPSVPVKPDMQRHNINSPKLASRREAEKLLGEKGPAAVPE